MRRRHTAVRDARRQDAYFSRETGSIRKKWRGRLPIALVFPNSYAAGMSNLGFQTVYGLLNSQPDLVAERFFVASGALSPPSSVESGRPLRDFPLILASISFEPDYLQLLRMLLQADIHPLAADRGLPDALTLEPGRNQRPLLIAGGVACFINPEPLAPFVDLFVIGEAEPVLPEIINCLRREAGRLGRKALLKKLAASFQGCYAPVFYDYIYQDNRLVEIRAAAGLPSRIRRIRRPLTTAVANHSQILTPDAEFAAMHLVELGRGCSRGCRFCAAGFVYRPPRLWPADSVIQAISQRPPGTDRVGLLGMEMIGPDDLDRISRHLEANACRLSFSSLRADRISPALLQLLAGSGLKSAAIAPDGGSERLRRVINKGLTAADLLAAADALTNAGIANLKLYFMIGLPTETPPDIDELLALTMEIRRRFLARGRDRGRVGRITLSVNCFIPKPWTPFQYHPFAALKDLRDKISQLRKGLARVPNVVLKVEKPENSFFQALIARGDRRLGLALLRMASENTGWRQALQDEGLNPDDYIGRPRLPAELFPWDIIDHGLDKNYLQAEYQKALQGRTSPACKPEKCRRCGVCPDI